GDDWSRHRDWGVYKDWVLNLLCRFHHELPHYSNWDTERIARPWASVAPVYAIEIAQTWQLANQSWARCRLNLVILVFPVVLRRTQWLRGLRSGISVRKVLRRTAAAGIRCHARSRAHRRIIF